jgi:N-glycosylase/DNA lyase
MASEFVFEYDPTDFSIDLCVFCGQVFRWKRAGERHWLGVDGSNWFDVQELSASRLAVKSSGSRAHFDSLFRFDWDGPSLREKMLNDGPELGLYIAQFPGLRLMRPSSSVETLFSFLCTPNNHLTRITAMIDRLGAFGSPFPARQELFEFPTLEVIAAIPEAELRSAGFGYRGATIPKAAQEIIRRGGSTYLESLRRLTYEEAHVALCQIPGVGPKLSDCIALYALDHTSAVPIDTHIWQAATRIYFPEWQGTTLTQTKYRAVSQLMRDRFGALAGWSHQYLFFENLMNWRSRKAV